MAPRFLAPLLLLAACAAPTESAPPRIVVAPEVAEDAVAALDLWTAATAGAFAPEVTVSDDCTGADWCITAVASMTVDDCPDATVPGLQDRAPPRACNWRDPGTAQKPQGLHQIRINASGVRPEERVSTLAHEAGHRLGLAHLVGTGDLMDPDRPKASRLAPCVSALDTEGAGMPGPGACAPPSAVTN